MLRASANQIVTCRRTLLCSSAAVQSSHTPRSNCVLDASKLQAAGITLRPVEEAVIDALKNWRPASA
jgi:hypothetical protein